MAAGDEGFPGGPPREPAAQGVNAADDAAKAPEPVPPAPFVDALKRASITSPFAAQECQEATSVKAGGAPPALGRSAGGKASNTGGGGRSGGGADAEAGRRGRRRHRRSPWLSAPMILGTEITTNITCVVCDQLMFFFLGRGGGHWGSAAGPAASPSPSTNKLAHMLTCVPVNSIILRAHNTQYLLCAGQYGAYA
jgi:hypothetical protein